MTLPLKRLKFAGISFLAGFTMFSGMLFSRAGFAPDGISRSAPPEASSSRSEGGFTFRTLYAQSPDAWATVDALKGAQGNFLQTTDFLSRKLGSFEDAFAWMEARRVAPLSSSSPLFHQIDLSFTIDALGTGRLQNPVVPELHASALSSATGRVGAIGSIGAFQTRFGLLFGYGRERRADASSTDLIEALPIRDGAFGFGGLEQSVEGRFPLTHSDRLALQSRLKLRQSYFHSDIAGPTPGSQDDFEFNWRWMNELQLGLRDGAPTDPRLSLHFVRGPQPLPFEITTVAWDYAHRTQPFSELGVLMGAGIGFETGPLKLVSGFYAGYPGAGVQLRARRFGLELGYWGIEGSSAYQTLPQRLWQGSFDLSF